MDPWNSITTSARCTRRVRKCTHQIFIEGFKGRGRLGRQLREKKTKIRMRLWFNTPHGNRVGLGGSEKKLEDLDIAKGTINQLQPFEGVFKDCIGRLHMLGELFESQNREKCFWGVVMDVSLEIISSLVFLFHKMFLLSAKRPIKAQQTAFSGRIIELWKTVSSGNPYSCEFRCLFLS